MADLRADDREGTRCTQHLGNSVATGSATPLKRVGYWRVWKAGWVASRKYGGGLPKYFLRLFILTRGTEE